MPPGVSSFVGSFARGDVLPRIFALGICPLKRRILTSNNLQVSTYLCMHAHTYMRIYLFYVDTMSGILSHPVGHSHLRKQRPESTTVRVYPAGLVTYGVTYPWLVGWLVTSQFLLRFNSVSVVWVVWVVLRHHAECNAGRER
ncbi:hypothetical protein F4802DRAFT_18461 [Xylaria palmicola]|nr:hypothetical protein F4802DRAFT_18461 [Xylaria palmicola]